MKNSFDVKLRFGIQDGKIVEITEVESGLACGCVCPLCGGRLEAVKGEKRAWHFRHYGEECNLVNAQQTALHILAKEIIAEEKVFMFPGYTIGKADLNKKYELHYELPEILEKYTKDSTKINCNSVVCEKRVSDIVPDIIVNVGGKECIIEIAVTHFVDETKRNKIIKIGIPTVEVDLSDYINEPDMREKLKDILVNKVDNKRWVYNHKIINKLKEAEKDYDELHRKKLLDRDNWERESDKKIRKQFEIAHKQKKIQTECVNKHLKDEVVKTNIDQSPTEEIKKIQYENGYNEIQSFDFDNDTQCRDRYGVRWVKCTECEKIKMTNEMKFYGGKGTVNKGLCRDCYMKKGNS